MKFIVLFGPPAVGKMTVGYELEKLTGLRLFHNHMTIDLVLHFFKFGSPPFGRLVNEFRTRIFEEVAASDLPGLIFTYVWPMDIPEDKKFIDKACEIFRSHGGEVYFVELSATLDERLRRNETEFRLSEKRPKRDVENSRRNLLEAERRYRLNSDGDFFYPDRHLYIDNTNLEPGAVAGAKSFTIHPRPSRSGVFRRKLKTSLRITGNGGLENSTCGARSFRTSRQSRMTCKRHFEVAVSYRRPTSIPYPSCAGRRRGVHLPLPGDHELRSDRLKHLRARVPDVVELTLGKLLNIPASRLAREVEDASLIVVRSQEIDFVGEADGDLLARQVMETVIANLNRAIRKLAVAGVEHFVIAADHGHQFGMRKSDDMKTDHPGGDTVEIHRRCWAGRGGKIPPGAVRVAGTELGYDTDVDFIFPIGIGVFKAGGDLSYHHGGISLQEIVIPVISFRYPVPKDSETQGQSVRIEGMPQVLTNRTFGVRLVFAQLGLFAQEPVPLRVSLIADNEQVGHVGLAVNGELDRESGLLRVEPDVEVTVALVLTRDDCESVRVVVQDPKTDAVIGESEDIRVRLGI